MVLTQKNIHIYMRMVHKCIQQYINGAERYGIPTLYVEVLWYVEVL